MYICNSCGNRSIKWLGKCPVCGEWETFSEDKSVKNIKNKTITHTPPTLFKEVSFTHKQRIKTDIDSLDTILGGGVVEGEVILIGGEPGIGKSTLLLQVASKLSEKQKTLYVSCEESPAQVLLRAKRLNVNLEKLYISDEDEVESIYSYVKSEGFRCIVVDSIQVISSSSVEGSKGTVSQIRGCADYLTRIAKTEGVIIFIIGHVTKEGVIAGPKLLEHIVDCVLYFEGEKITPYKILRVKKNRFGATDDFAVFEMTPSGLWEVKEIQDIFLPHRENSIAGSSICCVIEGMRPFAVELQALVSRASFGMVRRRCLGFDFNRFSLLVAIIEKRIKISLSSDDIFLNVAGGIRITDPAADLAAAISIVSSYQEKPLAPYYIYIGEIGLGGELRRVSNINLRIKEAQRQGFKECFLPEANRKEIVKTSSLKLNYFFTLADSLRELGLLSVS